MLDDRIHHDGPAPEGCLANEYAPRNLGRAARLFLSEKDIKRGLSLAMSSM